MDYDRFVADYQRFVRRARTIARDIEAMKRSVLVPGTSFRVVSTRIEEVDDYATEVLLDIETPEKDMEALRDYNCGNSRYYKIYISKRPSEQVIGEGREHFQITWDVMKAGSAWKRVWLKKMLSLGDDCPAWVVQYTDELEALL